MRTGQKVLLTEWRRWSISKVSKKYCSGQLFKKYATRELGVVGFVIFVLVYMYELLYHYNFMLAPWRSHASDILGELSVRNSTCPLVRDK